MRPREFWAVEVGSRRRCARCGAAMVSLVKRGAAGVLYEEPLLCPRCADLEEESRAVREVGEAMEREYGYGSIAVYEARKLVGRLLELRLKARAEAPRSRF